jgi:hypothetical protein
METKYYTPNIREFHVGFEYQWRNKDGFPNNEWQHGEIKDLVQITDIHNSIYELRIKFLDEVDIEGVGWKRKVISGNSGFWYNGDITIQYSMTTHRMYITQADEDKNNLVLFLGTIRNKSEFMRIMEQLLIS